MRPFSKWCLNHNVSTLDDLRTAGLDDFHDVPQGALGDAGVVVARAISELVIQIFVALALGAPSHTWTWIGSRGVAFIGPEEHPVGADLKDFAAWSKPPSWGELQNQVGGGLDHFLIAVNLHLGKTLHVLPGVAGQITGGMAEPQFGIGPAPGRPLLCHQAAFQSGQSPCCHPRLRRGYIIETTSRGTGFTAFSIPQNWRKGKCFEKFSLGQKSSFPPSFIGEKMLHFSKKQVGTQHILLKGRRIGKAEAHRRFLPAFKTLFR